MSDVDPQLMATLLTLENAAHEVGWDSNLPPHLSVVQVEPDGSRAAHTLLFAGPDLWARPAVALRVAAKLAPRIVGMEPVIAVILIVEVWNAQAVPGTPEGEELLQAARAHRLHEHPARQSARYALMATRPDRITQLIRRQNIDREPVEVEPLTSDLADGLLRILAALPTGN